MKTSLNVKASSIAQAIGLPDPRDRPLVEHLVSYLRDRELLIVLDNFEHLLPAAAVVARLPGHHLTAGALGAAWFQMNGLEQALDDPAAVGDWPPCRAQDGSGGQTDRVHDWPSCQQALRMDDPERVRSPCAGRAAALRNFQFRIAGNQLQGWRITVMWTRGEPR